ncbi:MAG TPA: MFS transporter [Nitrososphaerales archaeon]|nr:MFS transporter [Nitrososphaerales archaeon]
MELRTYLVSAFSAALVYPLYQVFLPLLASTLGAGAFEVGLIGGASNIVYSFMPFVLGKFTYRKRIRQFFIVFSSSMLVVISLSYTAVGSPTVLFGIRLVEGLAWALLVPSIEGGIASHKSPEASSLGILNFLIGGASAIGPFLGAYIIASVSIRAAFLMTTFVLIATLGANLIPVLKERSGYRIPGLADAESFRRRQADVVKEHASDQSNNSLRAEETRKMKVFFAIPTALCGSIPAVILTFYPPYATLNGVSIILVGAAALGYGAARFFTYTVLTRKNIRRRLLRAEARSRNLLASFALMCVPCAVPFFVLDRSGAIYIGLFAIVGVGYSICLTINQAALIGEAPIRDTGTAAGLFESSIGTGGVLAPVLAGLVSSYLNSLVVSFIVPFAVLFVMVALIGTKKDLS